MEIEELMNIKVIAAPARTVNNEQVCREHSITVAEGCSIGVRMGVLARHFF